MVLYDAMNYVEKRFAPRMRSIFEKFREKGKSIIYLTTNLEDALMFSDRICLLGAGKVEAEYSTADIRKNPRELIYLMSGLESGHWDDSEEKLVLESIIETRDTPVSYTHLDVYKRQVLMYPGSQTMALTVALTLVCTVMTAKTIGGVLPLAAKKLNLDPAIMASPLITTIVDAVSLVIYFGIAQQLLPI